MIIIIDEEDLDNILFHHSLMVLDEFSYDLPNMDEEDIRILNALSFYHIEHVISENS